MGPALALQTGKTRSRGLELEAKGEIMRHLQSMTSYAYKDAVTTEIEVAQEIGQSLTDQPVHPGALRLHRDHWLVNGLHAGRDALRRNH